MSASLVGSEMCIRDRSSVQSSAAPVELSSTQPSEGPRRAPPSEELLGTVSYTHLTLPTICSV
eukprot:4064046-Alexandrium_andersonii.AAC.1